MSHEFTQVSDFGTACQQFTDALHQGIQDVDGLKMWGKIFCKKGEIALAKNNQPPRAISKSKLQRHSLTTLRENDIFP
jgi:hypothetical protein